MRLTEPKEVKRGQLTLRIEQSLVDRLDAALVAERRRLKGRAANRTWLVCELLRQGLDALERGDGHA